MKTKYIARCLAQAAWWRQDPPPQVGWKGMPASEVAALWDARATVAFADGLRRYAGRHPCHKYRQLKGTGGTGIWQTKGDNAWSRHRARGGTQSPADGPRKNRKRRNVES